MAQEQKEEAMTSTPSDHEKRLRALVQQAPGTIRRCEDAVTRADGDPTALPELHAAMKKWFALEKQIDDLRLKIPDLSPELKTDIEKLDGAVQSINAKVMLVLTGQTQEKEALSAAGEEQRAKGRQMMADAEAFRRGDISLPEFMRMYFPDNE
jgi:hypothetical protein